MKKKRKTDKQNGRRSRIVSVLWFLGLLLGLALLAYPVVADWMASYAASQAVSSATQAVEQLSEQDKENILASAERYNAMIRGDARSWSEDGLQTYDNQLAIDSVGTMCWIKIPCIGVEEPVRHHADPDTLMSGAGHIEGTSLPIGGESTHTAIAGHTGMPGQRMFDDVDKLVAGNKVEIHILGDTLVYEVMSSEVIEPDDTSKFAIEQGQDLLTLVTCTPYGINDRRLLVKCKRIGEAYGTDLLEDPLYSPEPPKWSVYFNLRTVPFLVAIVFVVGFFITWRVMSRKNRKDDKAKT